MNSLEIENIGVMQAFLELSKQNLDIFVDLGGRKPFDCVVYNRKKDRLFKVEIKTTFNSRDGRAHFYSHNNFKFDVLICIYSKNTDYKIWVFPYLIYKELAISLQKDVRYTIYENNWSIFQ